MKEKQRVAFIIHSLGSGGAERVISLLSNYLSKKFDVYIFTHKKIEPFYNLNENIHIIPCFQETLRNRNFIDRLKNNWRLYSKIKLLIKQNDIDICISFMTTSNILSILAARSNSVPVIISERNNPEEEWKQLSVFWRILKKYAYPKTSKLVVQNNRIKSFYSRDIEGNKLEIIPNPINPELLPDKNIKTSKIILNIGRLEPQKSQETLIRAFANLNPPDWKLHIIGEGSLRMHLEKLIDKLQMNNKVKLLGKKKDVSKYYMNSRIFVLSSLYEGFPNVLLEAMQMGKACISSDCPTGPSDIILDGINGMLVGVGKTDELEKALEYLINNPDKAKELGGKAIDAIQYYQLENISSMWERLIDDLLI